MRYSDEHPEIKRLRRLLAEVRPGEQQEEAKQEAKQRIATAPVSTVKQPVAVRREEPLTDPLSIERAQARERVSNLKAQLDLTQRELRDRTAERARILRDLGSYQKRIEQLPVRDLEMASLTRNYEFSKGYYNNLLNKKTEAEMATDLERRQKAETFRILDPARPPTKPFKPGRTLLSAMSVAFGFVLGLVTAVGRELKAGVLLGEWELPEGIVVLSRVPNIVPALRVLEDDEQISGKRQPATGTHRFPMLSSKVLPVLGMMAIYEFVSYRF